MHVVMVTHSLPQPSSNGGPITCWTITKLLLEAGHRVTVIVIAYADDPFNTAERRATVLNLGIELKFVEPIIIEEDSAPSGMFRIRVVWALRQMIAPDRRTFFPTTLLASRMTQVIASMNPDVLFAYHWDSLASISGYNAAPKMAIVDDLWHMPNFVRWKHTPVRFSGSYLKWTMRTGRDLFHCPRFMIELLNECNESGCFQAHSARWLQANGARQCRYIRSPIGDAAGTDWRTRREVVDAKRRKPRVLLGPSNLEITSTSAGIRLFATGILPVLERELGPESFEVHVVGEGHPPSELKRLLPRPSVRLRGRVEPADEEFLSADVQLVPTPFVLGARKRILAGLSFGCCVVAHSNEAVNLPELVHGNNVLLARDGREIAQAVITALRSSDLRRGIGARARETYERCFSPEAAAVPIVRTLEDLAKGMKPVKIGVS